MWHDLCKITDLPADNRGLYLEYQGRPLAVFRTTDGHGHTHVHVLDDRCPHAGGSLSAGALTPQATPGIPGATCVICPMHGWPFNIATGQCPDNPAWKVRTYAARVNQHMVQIRDNSAGDANPFGG
ncbi:MAG: Rieske (2Fe-2S) protein [Phycisphaeraceae bacterium]